MTPLENLLRHISHVRQNCEVVGERLIASGDEQLGRQLIANGHVHDNSKFFGIEWEYLNNGANHENDKLFQVAVRQHVLTNPHHPEYWPNGIKQMPPLYLAEMVADWCARSAEQGTDLLDWIRDEATSRYGFTLRSKTYQSIREFVGLLLERKFE